MLQESRCVQTAKQSEKYGRINTSDATPLCDLGLAILTIQLPHTHSIDWVRLNLKITAFEVLHPSSRPPLQLHHQIPQTIKHIMWSKHMNHEQ